MKMFNHTRTVRFVISEIIIISQKILFVVIIREINNVSADNFMIILLLHKIKTDIILFVPESNYFNHDMTIHNNDRF